MSTKKPTPAAIEKAKKMYMAYESITAVSKAVGIPRSTITYHVKKEDNGWEFERSLCRTELLSKVSAAKSSDIAAMSSSAIIIIKRALDTLANRTDPPTVSEASRATAIFESLDKITRLDEGSPTDIIQSEKIVTVSELQKKIKLDPFNTVEEIEYEEVPE